MSKTGVPIERFSHPVLKLWRRYFGFSSVFDAKSNKRSRNNGKNFRGRGSGSLGKGKAMSKGRRRRRRKDAKSYMIAQMPHGIMVREKTLPGPFASTLNFCLAHISKACERWPCRLDPSFRAGIISLCPVAGSTLIFEPYFLFGGRHTTDDRVPLLFRQGWSCGLP